MDAPNNIPADIAKKKRIKIAGIIGAICLVVLLFGCWFWFGFLCYIEYTDDAYVEGNQVYITPLHDGFVTAIHTDDTYLVEKGQVLIDLDTTDAVIRLDLAKENLAKTVREVCELLHQVFAYAAEIEVKKAELIRAMQDYEHREGVINAGGISLEDLEHATAALRASFFSLEITKALYHKSLSMVQGVSIKQNPLVLGAADAVRDAWVLLYRCKIYSPVTGLVAQRTIQVGMWAKAGDPLMSVIPLNEIWVNANFKETQLKHMRIGQDVKITSDLYGDDITFHGKIVGLPGGAGNAFSLLPPQNLSGNWIKIVQRLPVRVALNIDDIKHFPLRVGLSMEATVDIRNKDGEFVPISTEGSPKYETSIFELEEAGDQELIEKIIQANLDPFLSKYANTVFVHELKEK
ncbi:MAG: efflux RND transporter periplasmic adaptor subunit [Chlamydiales bacterium]|nr:efflux RND transporter periplasmic adaptor subunit [Chlamydiales bacterium]